MEKWRVTYTKHVKQKRKVYQDGFLHLLPNNNNKVMLYDECEKLLDSRFLRNDEAVKAGESLAFSSFLVDIGDPESSNCGNTVSHQKIKSEFDNTTPQKTRVPRGDMSRNGFASRKYNSSATKTSAANLSPSQKIIREFKKNEVVKYSAQQSPTSAATSSYKEWEALYTGQITQKAKKYHDGFIRLVIFGSQGRQAVLYDSSKTQIDKRFLKKDEVISSGESLKFDAYLVDIGDALGQNDNDADVNTQSKNYNTVKPEGGKLMSKSQRSEVPKRQENYRAVVTGQPPYDACFRKSLDSNFSSLEVDKMKQRKTSPSHLPVRDARHILSCLKKPIPQDKIPVIEKVLVNQCPSQVVQLEIGSQALKGTLQSDPYQGRTITENCNHDNSVQGGNTVTQSEGHGSKSETSHDSKPTFPVDGGCSNNNVEKLVPAQGVAFDFPNKSHPLAGSLLDKLQASVGREQSVIFESTEVAGSVDSLSSLSSEAQINHHQPSSILTDTNLSRKEQTASTMNKSRATRLLNYGACMKINSVATENSKTTLECPSFDLGI